MAKLASVLFLLLSTTLRSALGYDTYYVEKACRSGNLSLSLHSGNATSAVLMQAAESGGYSVPMDCQIKVSAPVRHKVVVAIREIEFRTHLGGTCQDYLKIDNKPRCKEVFRLDEELHFISKSNLMEMTYHVSKDAKHSTVPDGYAGFKITVTAVMEGEEACSSSGDDFFRCRNDFCVWTGLRCDTHNNCGDLSDEQDCGPSTSHTTTVLVILGAIILLLLLIMCSVTLLCTKNESMRRFSNRLRSRTLSYLPRFPR